METKLSSVDLAKLFHFAIYVQADRIIKAVGLNLVEAATKNPRLWVAILFAFDHLVKVNAYIKHNFSRFD